MDQDDPEKRGSGRHAGSRRRLRRLVAIAAVAVALIGIGFAAYDFCAYLAGTPTTATTQQCKTASANQDAVSCNGAWRIGGKSYSGPIAGHLSYRYRDGKSLDVRVLGGTAYTFYSGLKPMEWVIFALFVGVAFGGVLWRRRTGR